MALSQMGKAFGGSSLFQGKTPDGPFQPYWESLKAYRCPDWFRDAKFGIWAPGTIPSYQLSRIKFDSTDIRFTTKGGMLYAIALGWPPDGKFVIRSLAASSANYPGQIRDVQLLGVPSALKWTRTAEGLEIQSPPVPPCKYAYAFRILPT